MYRKDESKEKEAVNGQFKNYFIIWAIYSIFSF